MVHEEHTYTFKAAMPELTYPEAEELVKKAMAANPKIAAILASPPKLSLETWHVGISILQNVHRQDKCQGPCPFHSPSDHHMVDWDVEWDQKWNNSPRLWRICPDHEVGHPDPDVVTWMKANLKLEEDPGDHHCDCVCCNPDVFYDF